MEANVDNLLQAQRSTGKDGTPPSPELCSSSTHYGVERCVVVAAPSCAIAYSGLSMFCSFGTVLERIFKNKWLMAQSAENQHLQIGFRFLSFLPQGTQTCSQRTQGI